MSRAVVYVRVSTEEQADSRAGMEAQKAAILSEAERRGWTVVRVIEDAGWSGKDLNRPGIQEALAALKSRKADTLVVAKLDRLSRSLLDFCALMDRAQREHWALVALDLGVDTTTPSGEAMANVMMAFAQMERRLISVRTREAMAAKKRRGEQVGRPTTVTPELEARIRQARADGMSLRAIGAMLEADAVPTGMGGRRWYAASVKAVLDRTQP